jgi:putative transposase
MHRLSILLSVAELSRSTFYYHAKLMENPEREAPRKQQILGLFHHHKGRYGYRRITQAMRNDGHIINHKAVQRLMQEMQLKSLVRPKKYRSYRGPSHAEVPNRLQRNFEAQKPNQKWVTDVTEFKVQGEKLYLSTLMDLHNREIVAHQMSSAPSFSLVSSMLEQALKKLPSGEKPILHSDQGWQYQMAAYRRTLQAKGIVQSMSRKGNCLDNAAMESFFGTLKSELFHLETFRDVEDLKAKVRSYIRYYNQERIQLKLKGLSPVMYRTQPWAA